MRRYLKIIFMCMVVLGMLHINKMLIKLLSFEKLVKLYSNSEKKSTFCEAKAIAEIKLIFRSFHFVLKYLPWKPKCFEQSLTVLNMARIYKIPSEIYFGIRKDELQVMYAHAWSKLLSYDISGFQSKNDFTVVYKIVYNPYV